MKKMTIIATLIVCCVMLNGCSSKNAEPVSNMEGVSGETEDIGSNAMDRIEETGSNTENNSVNYQEPVEEKSENKLYPNEVSDIYEKYLTVIKDNNSELYLSSIDMDSVENSVFYKFDFGYNKSSPIAIPRVTFHEFDGVVSNSFSVSLPDECENSILKQVILYTVLVLDQEITYDEAEEKVHDIISGFDGKSQSEIFEIGEYKLFLMPKSGTFTDPELEVVSQIEINAEIDISEYKDYTSQEMQAPLNQGEKAHLTGTIKGLYELNYTNAMEVVNGDDTYCIYYNPTKFAGCFSVGQECDFYGEIATAKGAYAGYLRIDYFQEK